MQKQCSYLLGDYKATSLLPSGTQSKLMLRDEKITLKEFISPVSVCYQDSNLETLITEAKYSTNGLVAIVDQKRSPIGVIHSHSLLSFLTEKDLASVIGGVREDIGIDKSQVNKFSLNFQELINPTIVVSSQLKIRELLPHLQLKNAANLDGKYYLVVDLTGQLLGILDTYKLLGFLLTQANEQPELIVSKKTSVAEDLYTLLDKIPLPIMLKSKEGNVLYRNLYCQNYHPSPQGDMCLNSLLNDLVIQPLITKLESNYKIIKPDLSNYQTNNQELSLTCSEQSVSQEIIPKNTLLLEKKLENYNYLKLPLHFTADLSLDVNSPLIGSWLAIGIKSTITIENNSTNYDIYPNDDLVELDHLTNEFLLNLGHDLKSPLTAIVGLSRLLKDEKLGQLNKRQIRYTDLIYYSGQKLMRMINDLLDISRVAAGKLEINLEELAVRNICEEVYQQVIDQLEFDQKINKNNFYPQFEVPLNLEIAPTLETIIADKSCLCKILSNLLQNALKFTFYQGKIGIKIDDWQQWIAITIWDEGMAIPESIQHSLLEKSFESNNNPTWEGLDNSLGLIFAQQLAQANGGDISFISTVYRGNNFTVLLPQNLQEVSNNNQNNLDDLPQSSLSQKEDGFYNYQEANNLLVLVIETASSQIEDISSKLEDLGYHSVIARSTKEALYKAYHLKPSKILLNSELPLTWNQDIIALLGTKSQTRDIPVFMMSSVKDDPEQLSSVEEPILPLPLTIESLMLAFPPVVIPHNQPIESHKSLTILRLFVSSELEQNPSNQDLALDFVFSDRAFTLQHRIIEADSLEQANILARIWHIDAIILDGKNLLNPVDYLVSLQELDVLSSLPLITLDTKTTQAANQINGLSVFPCLVPSDERSIAELIQVIQIATRLQ